MYYDIITKVNRLLQLNKLQITLSMKIFFHGCLELFKRTAMLYIVIWTVPNAWLL